MKLKKLEITGFKSFMGKTRVEFPSGTTAVVGPNGCGKSNVVDALRWVMGEQSVRKLRGKTSEDIIFAGSSGNAPLNMAEVSLTIDNEDGSVVGPFNEYSEITVTRRLFRSGESGYFINRQPARLKDIQTLFLGSGTGKNAFAVIQQGNIGALTDATPEERRVFIEEAADVTKYKARKKETESKIKSTRENLERVRDILAELERQLSTLKHQAKKALLFKEIQKKIRDLDITLSGAQYLTLNRQEEALGSSTKTLKEKLKSLGTKREALSSAMDRLKLHAQETTDAIETHNRGIYELKRLADRHETEVAHLREKAKSLEKEAGEDQSQLVEAKKRQDELNEEIQRLQKAHGGEGETLTTLEEKLTQAQVLCESTRKERSELEKKHQKKASFRMEMVAREAAIRHTFTSAEKSFENATRKLKRRDEERAGAKARLAATRQTHLAVEKEMARLKEETTELREHLDERRDALHVQETKEKAIAQKIHTKELEESRIRSYLETMEQMVKNLEGYGDGVKEAIEQLNGLGSVTHKVVADLIQVKKGYELAAETALKGLLSHVVVETMEKAERAASAMTKNTQSRCGFLPSDFTKAPRLDIPTPAHCLRLADLISLDRKAPALLSALISRCFIASDLSTAIKARFTTPQWVAIATPDGSLVDFSGAIVAGNKNASDSLLKRRTEMDEAKCQQEAHHHLLQELFTQKKEVQKEVARGKESLRQAQSEFSELLREKSEKEKACLLAHEAVKQSSRHLEIMELETQQLEGDLQDLEKDMETSQVQMIEVQKELQALSEGQEKIRKNQIEADEKLEAAEKKLIEIRLELTKEEAKHENHRSTVKRLTDFFQEAERRITRLKEGAEKKKKEAAQSLFRSSEIEESLVNSFAAITKKEEALALTRSKLMRIEADAKEKENEFKHLASTSEEHAETLKTHEVELASLITRKETLKAHVQEQYRTPIQELTEAFEQEIHQVTSGQKSQKELKVELEKSKSRLRRLGEVNPSAVTQYEEVKQRHEFLTDQQADLTASLEDLEAIIRKINRITQDRFIETFHRINEKLEEIFPRLFEGGSARLVLTDPKAPLETGVELMIQPPGKKQARLSLLSGGEKALSAIAFVFSIFLLKPSSFCVMDEIDAPLDDANVLRFNNLLTLIAEKSQILVITHNKITMEHADILLGVTMEKKGVSKVVAVNLTGETQITQDLSVNQ
ncbi:MAG: chromosome segregation protein SMC [Desulfobacterales bacterium]|nr:chromosome segregation protein SMC [Desulfobacterales bacterium]